MIGSRSLTILAFAGVIAIAGFSTSAAGQNSRRPRNNVRNSQDRGISREMDRELQTQIERNQQRYDQRRQTYQTFHQDRVENRQRIEPQQQDQSVRPRIRNEREKDQVRPTWNQPERDRFNRRAVTSGEDRAIESGQRNWNRREKNWQSQYDLQRQAENGAFAQSQRLLRRQDRTAQREFENSYWDRVREDRDRLRDWNYDGDGAIEYSYLRDGRYYYTSAYGMNLLRQALNDGYEEGYLAGQADRYDGYGYDISDDFAYQDATYGYNGYWVALNDYQFYFREAFEKGYDDGYYGRSRYGSYYDGSYFLRSDVLDGMIDFTFIGG